MNEWSELKKAAREWHDILLKETKGNSSANALLDAASRITGIDCIPCPSGDSLLMGAEAILYQNSNLIFYNQDVDKRMAAFYQMHEYAHHKLKHEGFYCAEDELDPEASEENTPLGLSRVETYNSKARVEREANIYAREVFLPSNRLRDWFLNEGKTASEIADWIEVPEGMVFHQLSFALLVSDLLIEPEKEEADKVKPVLNDSQKEVAEWTKGPLLVEAGPGTGKTRALIGRAEFLLKEGVDPSSILALTFSSKAAEEMRTRLALAAPDAAPHVLIGTFHAFGLEFLRKYGPRIGINPDFGVLDPVDAIFFLERELPSLKLDYYRNLYEPTMYLPDMLSNISRAKDELVGPDRFMELSEAMRITAESEEEEIAAEKAVEVAGVYAFYQKYLEENSMLDFGDLIFRSVVLLQNNPDVQDDIRHNYSNILVDEYQDVNRASGILLREIAGKDNGLWVVGDTRQSIYRFRGAAPSNVATFAEDFPGAETRNLDINYRSRPAIVNAFSELAPKMLATMGKPFIPWKPFRKGKDGSAVLSISSDLDSEVGGIADEINRLNKTGVPFRRQAILCRSHTTMERIAIRLEEANVPIFYLGDIFERVEIRDLLSLVSLASEGDGRGLIRVARFPEYDIPLDDVLTLFKHSREQDIRFPKALSMVEGVEGLSKEGKKRLDRLNVHLEGICYGKTAWSLLAHYLFNRSNYLVALSKDSSLNARQKRLAIYQFLQFAHGVSARHALGKEEPKRAFLSYVRRLELQGADKVLRQVPEWASGLDAVRLLTIHASKGLEFNTIFIPYLGKGIFPLRRQGTRCPLPLGLLDPEFQSGAHDEEEECLFFVALSRARDHLYLSRSLKYNEKNSNPSDILEKVSNRLCLIEAKTGTHIKQKSPTDSVASPTVSPDAEAFDVRDLDIHMKCPKKYFYENVLVLGRRRKDSGYVQFHQCVYGVLRWMGEERSQGSTIKGSDAIAKLEDIWANSGPKDHPYEGIYRENAQEMVSLAVNRFNKGGKPLPTPEWEITLTNGGVKLTPDFLEELPEAAGEAKKVQALRFRTGRRTKNESRKEIYAVYQAAVEKEYGDTGKVKIVYLSTDESEDINLNAKTKTSRLNKYNKAISGISGASFTPNPNNRDCPRCPHYFICSTSQNS